MCLARLVARLAGAKVRLFPEPPKLLQEKIEFFAYFLYALDLSQPRDMHTPYYILYKRGVTGVQEWKGVTDDRIEGRERRGRRKCRKYWQIR